MDLSKLLAAFTEDGTNTGPMAEEPPTGRSVSIKGASILQVEGDKIASDQS
jgi:hypothetical protein